MAVTIRLGKSDSKHRVGHEIPREGDDIEECVRKQGGENDEGSTADVALSRGGQTSIQHAADDDGDLNPGRENERPEDGGDRLLPEEEKVATRETADDESKAGEYHTDQCTADHKEVSRDRSRILNRRVLDEPGSGKKPEYRRPKGLGGQEHPAPSDASNRRKKADLAAPILHCVAFCPRTNSVRRCQGVFSLSWGSSGSTGLRIFSRWS